MRSVLLGVAVLSAAAAPLVAAPAHAGVSNTSYHYLSGDSSCPDNLRNRGQFVDSTDNVRSIDDCADGWGADTELLLSSGTYKRCYNTSGDGTTKVCDFEFTEGKSGQILARSLDNGAFKSSGDPAYIVT